MIRNHFGRAVDGKRATLLPHEVMGFLWNENRAAFHSLLGTSHLEEVWAKLMRNEPEYIKAHPLRQEILDTGGKHIIPFRLFGDDGSLGKTEENDVASLDPLLLGMLRDKTFKDPALCLGREHRHQRYHRQIPLGDHIVEFCCCESWRVPRPRSRWQTVYRCTCQAARTDSGAVPLGPGAGRRRLEGSCRMLPPSTALQLQRRVPPLRCEQKSWLFELPKLSSRCRMLQQVTHSRGVREFRRRCIVTFS